MEQKQVAVTPKSWYTSWTMIINGVFFILTTYVAIINQLTGTNLLTPLLGIFITDPMRVAPVVTTILQISSAINILLRMKTKAPLSS